MTLTTEQLLAGGSLNHEVEIPLNLLGTNHDVLAGSCVVLRPLTVRDLQNINKAAREDDNLPAWRVFCWITSTTSAGSVRPATHCTSTFRPR
jgi:hypothetical protein